MGLPLPGHRGAECVLCATREAFVESTHSFSFFTALGNRWSSIFRGRVAAVLSVITLQFLRKGRLIASVRRFRASSFLPIFSNRRSLVSAWCWKRKNRVEMCLAVTKGLEVVGQVVTQKIIADDLCSKDSLFLTCYGFQETMVSIFGAELLLLLLLLLVALDVGVSVATGSIAASNASAKHSCRTASPALRTGTSTPRHTKRTAPRRVARRASSRRPRGTFGRRTRSSPPRRCTGR